MTAYISLSYGKRKSLEAALVAMADALSAFGIETFVFVDRYRFDPADETAMMKQALADIERCDLLLAETSEKGIGIGVEAGYAKAKQKPVIYLRQKDVEHSTTVSGISDYRIIYESPEDLEKQLMSLLFEFVKGRTDT